MARDLTRYADTRYIHAHKINKRDTHTHIHAYTHAYTHTCTETERHARDAEDHIVTQRTHPENERFFNGIL